MVYGAGALGTCATAILRALYPDVEVLVVARFEAQADDGPQARRDGDRPHARAAGDRGGGGVVGRCAAATATACRWRFPASSTSCTTRSASRRRSRSASRVLKARGTLVKAGRARSDLVGGHAAVLQGAVDGRLERVRVRGGRRRAQARHRALPRPRVDAGSVDLTGMLTHTFTLDDWRDAFATLATQDETGAIKVGVRLPWLMRLMPRVVLVDIADRVAVITINRPEAAQRAEPRRAQGAARGDRALRRRRRRRRDDPHRHRSRVLRGRRPQGVRLGQVQQGEGFAEMGER